MKKIETKEQGEKRKKRNHLLIGIVMVGLMVLSTGGYAIMNNESSSGNSFIKYNNVKFYSQDGYWVFNYNNQQFSTQYNPEETKNITVQTSVNLAKYSQAVVYFDTESGQPNNEIYRNIYPFILKTNGACLENETCSGNYPIKDCSNNIIIIKEPSKNETERIYQEQNCIFIKAYEANQTKFADAFLFKLLGI